MDNAGVTVKVQTIGEAWLAIARHIVEHGHRSTYDDLGIREVLLATLRVEQPNSSDPTIDHLADPERLAWMHANFSDHGGSPSSAMPTATPHESTTTPTPAGTSSRGWSSG